jgi:hypothetical protein
LLQSKDAESLSELLCVEKYLFCQVSVCNEIWNNSVGWGKQDYKGPKSAKKGSLLDDKQE